MDIGIIGAGAAGLTAAWLLNDNHNVTVFEKENRLGGHAHTVEVERDGEVVSVESGFEFFAAGMWPVFSSLLKALSAPIHKYQATVTLYTTGNSRVYTMPMIRNNRLNWSTFKPHNLSTMMRLQRVLRRARPIIETGDKSITLEQFIEKLNVSRSFKEDFFYPLMLAGWCMEMEEFKQFSAYNVLKYVVLREAGRFSQFYSTEIIGGNRAYINALVKASPRVTIRLSAKIRQISRPAGRYIIEDADGAVHEFDHLIIATNARQACDLITSLEATEAARRELSKVEYTETSIAVHGDRRFMPASERHWSTLNARFDSAHSSNTVWKRWKSKTPIFKSWVTFDARLPEPLYSLATYYHPKVNLKYFEAQQALSGLQGHNNLWFAGLHTHDVDSHESAVVSAVKIARRLDPLSLNLNRLTTENIVESAGSPTEKTVDRQLQPAPQNED